MNKVKPVITYNSQLGIIFIDYSGLTLTKLMLEQVLAEIKEITGPLPQKVFIASCLRNTTISTGLNEEFGQLTAELLTYVRGVVRYGVNDSFTNIMIRTSTVSKRLQDIQSHIYPHREAALAAIYKLQEQDNLKQS